MQHRWPWPTRTRFHPARGRVLARDASEGPARLRVEAAHRLAEALLELPTAVFAVTQDGKVVRLLRGDQRPHYLVLNATYFGLAHFAPRKLHVRLAQAVRLPEATRVVNSQQIELAFCSRQTHARRVLRDARQSARPVLTPSS